MTKPFLPENQHAKHAKALLVGYIGMIMLAAGIRYDGDNHAEIEEIVDEILAAAQAGIDAANEYHHQQEHGEFSIIARLDAEYYKEKK